jgi:hypothetical protein
MDIIEVLKDPDVNITAERAASDVNTKQCQKRKFKLNYHHVLAIRVGLLY